MQNNFFRTTTPIYLTLFLTFNVSICHAFQCYFTLVKDSCWKNYAVTAQVKDAQTNQLLASFTIPAQQMWSRQRFECMPNQNLGFDTTFSPSVWEQERGKHYVSIKNRILPDQIKPNETAWNITLCYAKDFMEVPLPPEINAPCQCNVQEIPSP